MSRKPERRPAGKGSIYWDDVRGRWIGQAPPQKNYATGGVRRRKLTGREGESFTAFEKRFDALVREVTESEASAPDTVGELVEQWFATLDPSAPRQSQGNIDRINHQVRNHVLPVLGDIPIKALTVDDVEAWLANRTTKNGEPFARSTVKKLRSILGQAYDYGTKRRYVTWNPARVADLPKSAPVKREGRALTVSEIESLFGVCADDRLGAWIVVGVTMGLRPGEISGLVWDAVDFEAETITVYQSLATRYGSGDGPYLKTTKTGRTRTLRMPDVTARALEEHQNRQEAERRLAGDWPAEWSDLVFVTPYGTPLDRANTRRMVQRLARDAGIEGNVTSYDVRHTASEFASSKVSMERLGDFLGHRDTDTVQRHYRHPETNVIEVAAEVWKRTGSD